METPNGFYTYDDVYFNASGLTGWHAASFGPITRAFVAAVPESRLGEVLDFGCGDGFYGPFLAGRATAVDGVDYAAAAAAGGPYAAAYRHLYQADLGQPWVHPADRTYDLLFSTEVIEHVLDYRQFLDNAFRLLRPGGRLVLTTTTYLVYLAVMGVVYKRMIGPRSLAEFTHGLWDYSARTRFSQRFAAYTGGHHHGFTKAQLRAGLRAAGFRVDRLDYLFAQDVVHLHHLDNPSGGGFGPVAPVVRAAGRLVNAGCRRTGAYAPNVFVVARRP